MVFDAKMGGEAEILLLFIVEGSGKRCNFLIKTIIVRNKTNIYTIQ